MASLNRVTIIGNLGADPEVKTLPSGKTVANFSVACNESWTDNDGKKVEKTEWVRCTAWAKLGELAGKYLSKGRQVYVEGRLQTREYEKDGVKRYATDVVASNVVFLGAKDGGREPGSDDGEV